MIHNPVLKELFFIKNDRLYTLETIFTALRAIESRPSEKFDFLLEICHSINLVETEYDAFFNSISGVLQLEDIFTFSRLILTELQSQSKTDLSASFIKLSQNLFNEKVKTALNPSDYLSLIERGGLYTSRTQNWNYSSKIDFFREFMNLTLNYVKLPCEKDKTLPFDDKTHLMFVILPILPDLKYKETKFFKDVQDTVKNLIF